MDTHLRSFQASDASGVPYTETQALAAAVEGLHDKWISSIHQLLIHTMIKPTTHIFVCGSFRPTGAQGVCHKKESSALLQYLEQEAADRGLDGVMVSSTGCMKACDHGPVVIVYPEGSWYRKVNEEVADAILDAIENGTVAEEHLLPV